MVLGVDGQHGTGGQANDLFGNAAEQQPRQPRVTVCADDDQVDRVSFRVVDDVSDGLADDHRANDGEAAGQSGFHSHRQLQFGVVNELELENMLEIAETVAHSGLQRTESRGSHQRVDHPKRDDEKFLAHSLAYRTLDGSPRIDYLKVVVTNWPPAERTYGEK